MAAADLVLFNGKVFTAEPGQALAQAVAVQDGKILQVGSDAEIQALADANTQRIDLAGKVLMPGLIDTHSHPVVAAFDSMGANLQDEVKPLAELEQWIIEQDQAGRARAGDVISIAGTSSAYWDKAREMGQRFNQGRYRSAAGVQRYRRPYRLGQQRHAQAPEDRCRAGQRPVGAGP